MREGNQVWYGISRTINLGNFENLKVDVGESRTVNEGESSEEVYKSIRKDVNNRLGSIVNKLEKDSDG